MRLVTFAKDGMQRVGSIVDQGRFIVDLQRAAGGAADEFSSMQKLIEAGEPALERAQALSVGASRDMLVGIDTVKLLPPIPKPVKMRDCQMYHSHVSAGWEVIARLEAAKSDDPEAAYQDLMKAGKVLIKPILSQRIIYYNCDTMAMSGPEDVITWPAETKWMDYELEWAVVIGKPGRNISKENARDHIFGYTIFNDFSARDVQLAVTEAMLGPGAGKDFDFSNGLGPCIATKDEFPEPYDLTMTARVNGEEWSRGSTSTMDYTFEEAIEILSWDRSMHAGEILASGTVLTGCGFERYRRLHPGDTLELEIEGIGILRNYLQSENPTYPKERIVDRLG